MDTGLFDKNGTPINIGDRTAHAVLSGVKQAIAEQPADYDADKVIRKIAAATNIDGLVFYVDGRPVIYKEQAIEIIRSGGRQQEHG